MGFYVGLSSNGALIDEPTADRIAGDRLRLCRHQPRRHRRRPRPVPPPGRAPSTPRSRGMRLLPGPRHQGRPALHRDRAQRRRACRRCSTSWRRRASTSSTCRTSSTPAAATATAATTPHHRTTRAVMDLAVRALLAHVARRPATRSSSPATTTPTASTSCAGSSAHFPERAEPHPRQARAWGGNASGRQRRQHRQSGQRPPRHVLVALQPRQRASERPVRRDLAGHVRPDHGGAEGSGRGRSTGRCGACRRFGDLRRQHARARDADHRRPLGRGPRLLPHRRGDRPCRRSRASTSAVARSAWRRCWLPLGRSPAAAADAAGALCRSTAPPATARTGWAAWARRCCRRTSAG